MASIEEDNVENVSSRNVSSVDKASKFDLEEHVGELPDTAEPIESTGIQSQI